ncbi:EAL domain-containing protein [Prodigiosinella aquatilis]|nr:EAL domain-containing protein [Prodigiosinella sp. LS101]WJV52833.1 EAL domain-containing protein [Prodigiosinella sp. LS101]WJV57186.1 EAL domain-containing protein [Pectobacteriaceae bacterium C111]
MSLFKQLLIAICLFMLVLFSGGFIANLESSREQYNNQLNSHAQDSATALGLALTPNIDDPVMVELMVSSIFDSGYFSSIRVLNIATHKVILERTASPEIPDVPSWFVHLVNLQPGIGEATIMRGWEQAARVKVISHPMFAVARLWQSTVATFVWLLACGAIGLTLGALFLRRQLRPLDYMVEQSMAISRHEFLSLSDLPKTPELRRVVEAMNFMVTKLKTLFEEEAQRSEQLRQEAYQDPQTGLANRRAFDTQLKTKLSAEDTAPGYLLMIRLQDLGKMNQRLGGTRTDELLISVANIIHQCKKHTIGPDSVTARIRGGEFALFCPGLIKKEAAILADTLSRSIEALFLADETDISPVAHVVLVPFHTGDTVQSLFIQGDQLLTRAEHNVDIRSEDNNQESPQWVEDQHYWFSLLKPLLDQEQVQLFLQPVVNCLHPEQVMHQKVLARITDKRGNKINAGKFLSWIQRFGWSTRLDQIMVKHALAHLEKHEGTLALSLSGSTVLDLQVMEQLLKPLQSKPALAKRLIMELDENQLPDPAHMESLVKLLNEYKCKLGLQHFGGRFMMIGNLSQWGLAYLKIDGSYIRDIDQEEDKKMFIEALHRATNNIDLPLIAERVETEGELQVLQEMGIQGAMGRLLGSPVAAE